MPSIEDRPDVPIARVSRFWRSLRERARLGLGGDRTPEFPPDADVLDALSRRDFLRLAGAGSALLAAAGCAQRPSEPILPYGSSPPELTPGNPLHFATAMAIDGYAVGLIATSNDGRPTKIEGNPDHPASLGAAGAIHQASVLSLYDPARAADVFESGTPRDFQDFRAWLGEVMPPGGEGLYVLLEPTSSPTEIDLIRRTRARLPGVQFVFHSPAASASAVAGSRAAFGRALEVRPDLTRADVVLVLDGDPLAEGPASLRIAHDFAERRRLGLGARASAPPSRLWVAEPILTPTGSTADRRLRARAADIPALAQSILDAVSGGGAEGFAAEVAKDLAAHRGKSIVLAGERQPAATHVLAHRLNAALGNVGATLTYAESPIFEAGEPSHDLGALVAALDGGKVKALIVLEGNPCYGAPADLELTSRFLKVPRSAYLGAYQDETAVATRWFVPARHYLESWGDARAYDGTVSLVQPLLRPLVAGARTPIEMLALLAGDASSLYELVRGTWKGRRAAGSFELFWQEALKKGVVDDTALPAVSPAAPAASGALPPAVAGTEVVIAVDSKVHDGRFAGNAWLQELPAPMTKLTWGNAALISPATARKLDVETGDRVELALSGRKLVAPVFVLPGVADGSVGLTLGYGRTVGSAVAIGRGVDAAALRTSAAPWGAAGATIRRLDGHVRLAFTQEHWSQEGRPIALLHTVEEARAGEITDEQRGELPTLLREHYTPQATNQWAMVIDLSTCTGCSACVVACQAENNVPVVGRDEVRRGREMHWIRVDRYYEGSDAAPDVAFQPVMCQHCANAPCETVCPVLATVHSSDGLNEQIYNRCVGTRYCENNCPYKVRRFNWFTYANNPRFDFNMNTALGTMVLNPDVVVRSRGVMEKCSLCVQRIQAGKVASGPLGSAIADGRIQTACQQACPAKAIVFGDAQDDESHLAQSRRSPRHYHLLGDLGTRPAVGYLTKIRNRDAREVRS